MPNVIDLHTALLAILFAALVCLGWQAMTALCPCGAAAVCKRCGLGKGTIPCACMVARWSDAELVRRTVGSE